MRRLINRINNTRRGTDWRSFFEDALVVSLIGLFFAAVSTGLLALLVGFIHVLAMVG